ncbi:MFS transporter [Rathayibacter iranicus]|uniref:MFS transporter n=2 Tax=Rathayibacter iranicus TaxID=59737 RepID=A0AAD1AFV4_9MICO|nr:MFS transporter [Rathayibacter iranicus]MWV32503.1 MFS transporter [Rathayibacter iranicus NCPPB 2253 = VKM Ac-1602]PPI42888.1 MFS transporter [Rathayibacter iranicus]PPI58171.1 MFS transporter [Rathayibacter iranicus]PPI69162.1 MFS transporter [Rathayibacter iranicus]
MPIVSTDLDGRSLYPLAFAAALAAAVVGMVAAGSSADRRGPTPALVTAILLFTLGLIAAGAAQSMPVFVAARLLQGLGSGGITVTLYVLVARVYPGELHPRIFGAFAAAWVVPSLIGPFVAGVVAEVASWHWVFFGVVALVALASAAVAPTLRALGPQECLPFDRGAVGRIARAVVVSAGVVVLSTSAEIAPGLSGVLATAAMVVVLVAVRALLPAGTLRARGVLPSVILLRGLVAAAFFGTEVYLPLLLSEQYGLPPWLSGATLTAGALSWALGSNLQGRPGTTLSHGRAMKLGTALVLAGIAVVLLTTVLVLTPVVAAVGWFLAGGGMGTMFPRMGTMTLALSAPGREGFNSSALQIADSAGASVSLAVTGLLAAAVTGLIGAGTGVFSATFAYGALLALAAAALAGRIDGLLRREGRREPAARDQV